MRIVKKVNEKVRSKKWSDYLYCFQIIGPYKNVYSTPEHNSYKDQLYMMDKKHSEEVDESLPTPKSLKTTTKKDLHLKKLSTIMANLPIENCKTFVAGISGGDCAGKR